MNESVCYLNGAFLPLSQAHIPILDRGFIFGDGIYEVIPVFNGKLFRLAEHIARLNDNLTAVMIDTRAYDLTWTSICETLVERNGGGDQTVYVQVTRGVAPRDHALPVAIKPTIFAMSSPLTVPAEPTPVSAITLEDMRWQRCDIKSTSLLANVLAREQAARAGAREAIFVRDGWVTEGAASNVFVAHGQSIKTPPLSSYILPGVTRNLLVELFAERVPCIAEHPVSEQDLLTADEIWITSSSRELVPVVQLNGQDVGGGAIGPVFQSVASVYREYKAKY